MRRWCPAPGSPPPLLTPSCSSPGSPPPRVRSSPRAPASPRCSGTRPAAQPPRGPPRAAAPGATVALTCAYRPCDLLYAAAHHFGVARLGRGPALERRGVATRVQDRAVLGRGALARQYARVARTDRSLRAHRVKAVALRIAKCVQRVFALFHAADVVLQHLAEHDDSPIRSAQVLLGAVGYLTLGDPGRRILRGIGVEDLPARLTLRRQL